MALDCDNGGRAALLGIRRVSEMRKTDEAEEILQGPAAHMVRVYRNGDIVSPVEHAAVRNGGEEVLWKVARAAPAHDT